MNSLDNIVPLGTMGWMPAGERQTCCYCVEYGENLLLFDAGTGIARFGEEPPASIPGKYQRVFLFLSHYHLDHVSGFFYFSRFFRGKEIHVAGPGPTMYPDGVRDTMLRLVSPPFGTTGFFEGMIYHDLAPGKTEIGGMSVQTVLQEHASPSLGIRIDDAVCYCTDTVCSPDTVDFVRGCRVLLHESWFDGEDYARLEAEAPDSADAQRKLKNHSAVPNVAKAAKEAGVGQLVLIHLNPAYSPERLNLMEKEAQVLFPSTILAEDGIPVLN